MKGMIDDAYHGREQALIKHRILSEYLKRLMMIIGHSGKHQVINYVDCFAGPWESGDGDLADTSIGIALKEIEACHEGLTTIHRQRIRFRILYIEKDPERFAKLQAYVNRQAHPSISVECLQGDFVELMAAIRDWARSHFTFFFVDPKGWKGVVGATTLKPLLTMRNTEFLINLMYDFINRIVEVEKHQGDMQELLGQALTFESDDTPENRQKKTLSQYRASLKSVYGGYSTYLPVMKPGQHRVHYFLVYLTRHPLGISVFKAESEKVAWIQRVTINEVRLRREIEAKQDLGIQLLPMFDYEDVLEDNINHTTLEDNRASARLYLERMLASGPVRVDPERWAEMLEDSDLFPGDFKLAMRELYDANRVENLSASVARRSRHIIKPENAETWRLIYPS